MTFSQMTDVHLPGIVNHHQFYLTSNVFTVGSGHLADNARRLHKGKGATLKVVLGPRLSYSIPA